MFNALFRFSRPFRRPAGCLLAVALGFCWAFPPVGLAAGPEAQPLMPSFQRISSEDGLSQMYVSAILQDSQGFLWVGTKDGLNRYDGRRFTVFHHIPFDPNSLSCDFITVIREDPQGYLWVGTGEHGVNRFDPDRERFLQICPAPGDPEGLSGDAVSDIAFGPDGSVWVGTAGSGLTHLVPAGPAGGGAGAASHGFNCRRYRHNPGDPSSLSSDFIRSLRVDSWGRLWIGTDRGLDVRSTDPGRSGGRDSFQRVPLQASTGADLSVMAICEDQGGSLWLGTQNGLYRYEMDNGRLVHIANQPPGLQKQLASLRVIWASPPDGTMWGGKLWLGYFGGLAIFDTSTGVFSYPLHIKDDPR